MLRFECDYGEGAAPAVLDLLQQTNFDQTPGYGEDEYCAKAAAQIRSLCDAPDADVHFFVGATQANLTVIAAALQAPGRACIAARIPGTSMCMRPAPVEATGHKVPGSARQKRQDHGAARCARPSRNTAPTPRPTSTMVQPGMVYISNPTEVGTLYT